MIRLTFEQTDERDRAEQVYAVELDGTLRWESAHSVVGYRWLIPLL